MATERCKQLSGNLQYQQGELWFVSTITCTISMKLQSDDIQVPWCANRFFEYRPTVGNRKRIENKPHASGLALHSN